MKECKFLKLSGNPRDEIALAEYLNDGWGVVGLTTQNGLLVVLLVRQVKKSPTTDD